MKRSCNCRTQAHYKVPHGVVLGREELEVLQEMLCDALKALCRGNVVGCYNLLMAQYSMLATLSDDE